MINKRQFVTLVKSILTYEHRLEQLGEDFNDLEITVFGDELCDTVQEFLVEVMDETKKDVLNKWFNGKYEEYNLYEDSSGRLHECRKGEKIDGVLIKLNTAGQLYDFLLRKKSEI